VVQGHDAMEVVSGKKKKERGTDARRGKDRMNKKSMRRCVGGPECRSPAVACRSNVIFYSKDHQNKKSEKSMASCCSLEYMQSFVGSEIQ
jgi:hypothetical protein